MLTLTVQSGLALLFLLVVATYKDVRHQRIPNWLTLYALVAGLLMNYLLLSNAGLYSALKGAGLGLVVMLPLYLVGGMGAGDVKLMAAVGSFTGPTIVLWAACCSLIVGACIAVFIVLRNGELVNFYRRYIVMISARTLIPAEEGSIAKRRFPYALSIATGTLIALWLDGQLEFTQLGTWIGSQLQVPGGTQ